MQQGIKKLQWFEYLKVVFLEILNPLLCRVFANQVTYRVRGWGVVSITPCRALQDTKIAFEEIMEYIFL